MRAQILLPLLLLAGCSQAADEAQSVTTQDMPAGTATPAPPPPEPVGPTPEQLAVLDSRDCREIATGYADGIARGAFAYAALFWNDAAGVDAQSLQALLAPAAQPRLTIADVQVEGGAGSLYCTVTVALADAADPEAPHRPGQIDLRRVNDVDGATAEQLRWSIRSSNFARPGDRSSDGSPA